MKKDQDNSRQVLLKLISSVKYLAENGLALRGKNNLEGNYNSLLLLRSEDDPLLKNWLERSHRNYSSPQIQNEILQLMSNEIINQICKDVNSNSVQFAIIIDGTQDIQGNEQEAICVRHVTNSFEIHEDLLGLYEVSSTTGEVLCAMLKDCLIRLQLPIENLRAQTYDGASNMSGIYKGCQSRVKELQPLANYYHCGAHITHLVTSKAILSAEFMRDAVDQVQELGTLYGGSGKFKHLFLDVKINSEEASHTNFSSLKPICPTRWLTRSPAVESVVNNYQAVLNALEIAANKFGTNTATRANGIRKCMSLGKCVLGLTASLPILQCLEGLNKALQGRNITISGMLKSVDMTIQTLLGFRTDRKFKELYKEAIEKIEQYNLEEICVPRTRKIPKRLDAGIEQQFIPTTPEEKYRIDFFKAIDCATQNLRDYFKSTDILKYKKLSDMLLTGVFDQEICRTYPELESSLKYELEFFWKQYSTSYSSLEDCRKLFASMLPEVRRMFPQVERLLRLLLVSPASSCEAERSFSSLRRIKTWLRSTMTQKRLNNVMICNVHKDKLNALDLKQIAHKFINNSSETRGAIFGKY